MTKTVKALLMLFFALGLIAVDTVALSTVAPTAAQAKPEDPK
jgi:hypothetical protein